MPSNQEIERETFAENAETRVSPTQFPTMLFIIKEVPSAPHSRMKERQVNQVLSSLQNLANSVPSASLQLAHFVYPCTHLPTHYHDSSLQTCPVPHLHRCSLLCALHLMWWPKSHQISPFLHEIWTISLCLTSLFFLSPSCFSNSITLTLSRPQTYWYLLSASQNHPIYISSPFFPFFSNILIFHTKKTPVNSLNELRIFFPKESV